MSTIIKFTLKFLAACEIARRLSNRTVDPKTGITPNVSALDYNFGTKEQPIVNGLLVTTKHGERAIWQLSGPELCALAEVEHVSRFTQRTKTAKKAKKAPAVKAPVAGTKADKRVVQMSAAKRAKRDEIFARTGGGVEYLLECKAAKIPLSARSKAKLASMQTVAPVAAVEATV